MNSFEPGTQVQIMERGEWVGPFTVTDGKGRTPNHLVLRGRSGLFEHYNDAPHNTRPYPEQERPRACLRCMNTTVNGTAVSRTDNKTRLCSDCELAEALEDMMGKLTPQDEWVYAKMSKAYGIEPVGLTLNKENQA